MKVRTKCPNCSEYFTVHDISKSESKKGAIFCRNCKRYAIPISRTPRRFYEILIIPITTLLVASILLEKLRIASDSGYLSSEVSNVLVYVFLTIFIALQAFVVVFLPHLLRTSYRKYKIKD